MDNGDGAIKKLLISGITENYVFHYIYIHPSYYEEIYRLRPENNALFIRLNEVSPDAESALGKKLIEMEQVASVLYYNDAAERFEDSVVSLNAIIICAALLAFVVLYNLTNINLSERLREIATIKVLGFYNREVSAYVYRENMILTFIGAPSGLSSASDCTEPSCNPSSRMGSCSETIYQEAVFCIPSSSLSYSGFS